MMFDEWSLLFMNMTKEGKVICDYCFGLGCNFDGFHNTICSWYHRSGITNRCCNEYRNGCICICPKCKGERFISWIDLFFFDDNNYRMFSTQSKETFINLMKKEEMRKWKKIK